MSKEVLDTLNDKVKYQIALEVINKMMSPLDLLDLIDEKLSKRIKEIKYSSTMNKRENQLTYSKAKTFISKTRTVLLT